jgi:hypothetical protein
MNGPNKLACCITLEKKTCQEETRQLFWPICNFQRKLGIVNMVPNSLVEHLQTWSIIFGAGS